MMLSKRDKGLLLGLAGVLIAALAYFFAFRPLVNKAETMKAELLVLQEREAQLEEMEANMEFYQDEIKRLEKEKGEYIAQFPSGIKEETEIMYAVELEDNVDVKFTQLNYGVPMGISADGTETIPAEADAQAVQENAESAEGELEAYCIPMVMTYQSSYQGLKDAITYTNKHKNRMVIDALTATFDATTGKLTGNMTLNMYLITGTGNLYEEPYVPAMMMGVPNIFGATQ